MVHTLTSVPSRLLGVGLTGLVSVTDAPQLGLFEDEVAGETERERQVSRTVDELRGRFGGDAVVPGRLVDSMRRRRGGGNERVDG